MECVFDSMNLDNFVGFIDEYASHIILALVYAQSHIQCVSLPEDVLS